MMGMQMVIRLAASALIVLMLCAAKSTIGNDFDDKALPRLEVGVTPYYDVKALLRAEPVSSQVGATGNIGYRWYFFESKVSVWTFRGKTRAKEAILVFDRNGIFLRILKLDGITLSPADTNRLMIAPTEAAE